MSYCKAPDTTNGNKWKTASVILKRGRTILKRRHEPKTYALRSSGSLKVAVNRQDVRKATSEDRSNVLVVPPDKREDDNSASAVITSSPSPKEAIKLEDKLISGQEIELSPAFCVDAWYTECNSENKATSARTAADEKRRELTRSWQSSKFYLDLNNLNSDDARGPTVGCSVQPADRSQVIARDYPKLYITVTNTSDSNAMAKNSLLKDIRGIQSADGDSYGINISNSRFFVPKEYVFSGVECAMNDLKFEVDPEMGKLLQRSHSTPQLDTGSRAALIHDETRPSSLDNAALLTLNTPNSPRQRVDSGTPSAGLRSKGSDKTERRLFLKKRESKSPRCEIIDDRLGERSLKPRAPAAFQIQSHAEESSGRLDNRDSVQRNEKDSRVPKYEDQKRISAKANVPLESEKGHLTPRSNRLPAVEVIISNDNEIITKSASTNAVTFEDGTIPDTFEEPTDSYGMPSDSSTTKRKSYPLSVPADEVSSDSRYLSAIAVTPPRAPRKMFGVHSAGETKLPEQPNSSINSEKQIGAPACNEQSQRSISSEMNRLNRLKFLQGSLLIEDANGDETAKASSDDEPCATNTTNGGSKAPESGVIAESGRSSVCKEHILPAGRTFSLRERFETIVEDVELRMAPGRRSQTSKSCDRKSLS